MSVVEILGLGLIVGASGILVVDLFRALRPAPQLRMDFKFSRYNMYKQKPGDYEFTMYPGRYNLPNNEPLDVEWKVDNSGFLDPIRRADVLFCGGSSAFGTGTSSYKLNVSNTLKNKFGYDIINLSIPGFNAAQEVITILKHLDEVKPKTIVLFHGSNDIAGAFPFNYWMDSILPDPHAFYGELEYGQLINEYYSYNSGFSLSLKRLLLRASYRFVSAKILHRAYLAAKRLRRSVAGTTPAFSKNYDAEVAQAFQSYKSWIDVLHTVCVAKKIRLIIGVQPYHTYGRSTEEITTRTQLRMNPVFDGYVSSMLNPVFEYLKTLRGVEAHAFYEDFKKLDANLFIDPVHLTNAGYALIAQGFHDIISKGEVRKPADLMI